MVLSVAFHCVTFIDIYFVRICSVLFWIDKRRFGVFD